MDLELMMLALVCGAVWACIRAVVACMDRAAEQEFRALQCELDEIMTGHPAATGMWLETPMV
jgi:hypothetical protein